MHRRPFQGRHLVLTWKSIYITHKTVSILKTPFYSPKNITVNDPAKQEFRILALTELKYKHCDSYVCT